MAIAGLVGAANIFAISKGVLSKNDRIVVAVASLVFVGIAVGFVQRKITDIKKALGATAVIVFVAGVICRSGYAKKSSVLTGVNKVLTAIFQRKEAVQKAVLAAENGQQVVNLALQSLRRL
ncbi:MAG: hypothetical protein SP4CHLAM5_03330 [Chlamydiia bacterium]|nr:hypothetical protein [Chlamydiia bacterium]MCH9618207.1 hypothetical protein [Chlamydiia bacterium]MCH9624070.1 hypothetical protein [Chlamydiia bacterium]